MDELKKDYGFYAMLHRMHYVDRWNLMRTRKKENLSEHSFETAVLAHALALIGRYYFHKNIDEKKVAVAALFHDAGEVITGDMPTPVKYRDRDLLASYRKIEEASRLSLINMLPDALKEDYSVTFLNEKENEARYVKAADKLSAYIKCVEEVEAGNHEFSSAKETTLRSLLCLDMEEIRFFMDHFMEAYQKNLDELTV